MYKNAIKLVASLGLTLGMISTTQAATVYTSRDAFITDTVNINTENFNSITDFTPYHSTPLDTGAFTISMTGTVRTDSGRNVIDPAPPQFASFDVDGTQIANVLIDSGSSLFLTFDQAIYSFGVDLASLNDNILRTEIIAANTTTTPQIEAETFVRFFGISSSTAFTTIEFRGIANDGFGMDNVMYSTAPVSAVPVPAAVWLFGSGLIGLAGIARRKK